MGVILDSAECQQLSELEIASRCRNASTIKSPVALLTIFAVQRLEAGM